MFDQESVRERVAENGETQQLRASVYARTSSKSQEYGYSLDAQVRRSIDRCESLGWKVWFVFRDEAESGKDTDRPMFRKMLSAAEKQVFDVVVIWKLDRFSRSLMHAVQLESELRQHNVSLYSVTEQIDTTSATGRFNFRNIASAAEFERDMIKQRTQMGLNELASELKWPNNSPPLGYELDSERKLMLVEQEADIVAGIFERYIEERSMPEVARCLNEQDIQTREGGEWTPRAVGDILRNEIYAGVYEVADISKHVPEYQIIDSDTFEEVKSIRHRFQGGGASKSSMSNPRKERAINRIREMYQEYRSANSVEDRL
ncbi:Site-specific DNA recombinase [Natronorubrum sediminis]|uniref:Site-specific DNA recombinase n=1 Tax=Natronorubrum sediminis TaxID=640943 RepID=A0A1H6FP45_9EURY|nr:recombinase family protein [Natronorubrum sediminis]SEH11534.1 Site-specific DNA recombinase [Natronorubrum sediminis]